MKFERSTLLQAHDEILRMRKIQARVPPSEIEIAHARRSKFLGMVECGTAPMPRIPSIVEVDADEMEENLRALAELCDAEEKRLGGP